MLRRGVLRAAPQGLALVAGARPPAAAGRLPGGSRSESTSSSIWKTAKANKVGLSKQLDATMHDGSHDMKAFGLGFLRSISSKEELVHMTAALFCAYTAMEKEFDALVGGGGEGGGAMAALWREFGGDLRRADALAADLRLLGAAPESVVPSEATQKYVDRIHAAAKENPDLLVGHFYTRYFADLFGGSMQGFPTRMALGLGSDLAFYAFPEAVERDRRAYIERIYASINAASAGMERAERAHIVGEARGAFAHNAAVCVERPGLVPRAIVGVVRVGAGLGYAALASPGEARGWLAKLGVLKAAA